MPERFFTDSILEPKIFAPFSNLVAAQSTRHGGVSEPPYETLNLGMTVGDARDKVLQNRKIFCHRLSISPERLAFSSQVHGETVLFATQPGSYEGFDALVTNRKNIFLMISIADCVPILIYDAQHQAAAAIHAGWRGTAANLVFKTLKMMQSLFGTDPTHCFAFIGVAIDKENYQVGEDVAKHFSAAFKQVDVSADGKFLLDLRAANAAQLGDFGIDRSQIEISPYSTYSHHRDFFSHRFSGGKTGRMMAIIGMR
ncbi:protein of unknown function DUF152 [Chloroherpeton thalassium ATCC 35110]|uniref:Purine nucleoside phosphorylase n=1 Tax=Chloroherpeton thalassium (strain ATCC 35110 / GB-78) TaxID=517418 RepID=B3QSP8_CHLT3|nr:peptidoglycan editing factor PgeF [Chloroherpeton thalassium]ACF14095.1 protein of unknown function DUF152 [Chloroherpeton thalassium ATCC 35110]